MSSKPKFKASTIIACPIDTSSIKSKSFKYLRFDKFRSCPALIFNPLSLALSKKSFNESMIVKSLAAINLDSEDYFSLTRAIVELANRHSSGRVISFLEGGYDLLALSESTKAHFKGLSI